MKRKIIFGLVLTFNVLAVGILNLWFWIKYLKILNLGAAIFCISSFIFTLIMNIKTIKIK